MVGFVGAEYDDGVGYDDFVQREAHGLLKVDLLFVLNVLNEVDEDFGIGIARKSVPLRCKKRLELGVVLNDSVVNDNESAGIRRVRVCIAVRRLTVGGPTGVSDSEGRMRTLLVGNSLKSRNLSHLFEDVKATVGQGNSGGIVSAVF